MNNGETPLVSQLNLYNLIWLECDSFKIIHESEHLLLGNWWSSIILVWWKFSTKKNLNKELLIKPMNHPTILETGSKKNCIEATHRRCASRIINEYFKIIFNNKKSWINIGKSRGGCNKMNAIIFWSIK